MIAQSLNFHRLKPLNITKYRFCLATFIVLMLVFYYLFSFSSHIFHIYIMISETKASLIIAIVLQKLGNNANSIALGWYTMFKLLNVLLINSSGLFNCLCFSIDINVKIKVFFTYYSNKYDHFVVKYAIVFYTAEFLSRAGIGRQLVLAGQISSFKTFRGPQF